MIITFLIEAREVGARTAILMGVVDCTKIVANTTLGIKIMVVDLTSGGTQVVVR